MPSPGEETPDADDSSASQRKPAVARGWRIGLAALAVVVVAGALLLFGGSEEQLGVDGRPLPEEPEEVVERYLLALQASDAEAAFQYLSASTWESVDIGAQPTLSREVVDASNYIAQLGDVKVGVAQETARDSYEVPATFSIGGQVIERTFRVRTGGSTLIYDGLVTVSRDQFTASGLKVNGKATTSNPISLFPGTYVFDAEVDAFELKDGEKPLTLADDDDGEKLGNLKPLLTAEAATALRELTQTSLDDCLASGNVQSDCGLDPAPLSGGGRYIDGTVERALSPEAKAAISAAIEDLDPAQRSDDPAVFELPIELDPDTDVTVTAVIESDGERKRGEVEDISALGTPSVDVGKIVYRVTWD